VAVVEYVLVLLNTGLNRQRLSRAFCSSRNGVSDVAGHKKVNVR